MSQSASVPDHRHRGTTRKKWMASQQEWRAGDPHDPPRRARTTGTCVLCGGRVEPGMPVHAWSFTTWMHQGCWDEFRSEPPEVAAEPGRRTVTPAGYRAYITSERWQAVRRRFWASGPKPCFCCGRPDGPKDLHHRTYKNLGRELPRDLVPLCRTCHDRVHRLAASKGIGLWGATNMIRRERQGLYQQAGAGRVTVQRKKTPGWVEVRAWQYPRDQVVSLQDDEAGLLAGLLTGGSPWGSRGRVAVEAAGEWVRVVVGRGSSKPPRTLSLRPGETGMVAGQISRILAGSGDRPPPEVPEVLKGRVRSTGPSGSDERQNWPRSV